MASSGPATRTTTLSPRRLDLETREVSRVEPNARFSDRSGMPRESNGQEAPFGWLFLSDVCKHCEHAGCLEACPTGAIFRTEVSTVYVQDDICNGCGYCIVGCPFGVIDRRPSALTGGGGAFKCTFCYDRQIEGLTPACAKACPTESIQFGPLDELQTARGTAGCRSSEREASRTSGFTTRLTRRSAEFTPSSCCSVPPRNWSALASRGPHDSPARRMDVGSGHVPAGTGRRVPGVCHDVNANEQRPNHFAASLGTSARLPARRGTPNRACRRARYCGRGRTCSSGQCGGAGILRTTDYQATRVDVGGRSVLVRWRHSGNERRPGTCGAPRWTAASIRQDRTGHGPRRRHRLTVSSHLGSRPAEAVPLHDARLQVALGDVDGCLDARELRHADGIGVSRRRGVWRAGTRGGSSRLVASRNVQFSSRARPSRARCSQPTREFCWERPWSRRGPTITFCFRFISVSSRWARPRL